MANKVKCLVKQVVLFMVISWWSERASAACNTFNNTRMLLFPKTGQPHYKTLNGCIERIAFDGETIVKVYIANQKISHLLPDTVRNMVKLSEVKFDLCQIHGLHPGAFRNVPRLTDVSITYNNISRIQRDVFNDLSLERLRLSRNNIDSVQDQAFSNMSKLTHLYINDNLIGQWNRKWFNNSPALVLLDFQNNKLKSLPEKAFHYTRNLKKIFLGHNDIVSFEPNAFGGLEDLDHLDLSFNKLTMLDQNIFSKKVSIGSLLINGNRLNFLSTNFRNQVLISKISIEGNPWKCSCLNTIDNWLYNRNIYHTKSRYCGASVPVCVFPKMDTKECQETVDEEATNVFYQKILYLRNETDGKCVRFSG